MRALQADAVQYRSERLGKVPLVPRLSRRPGDEQQSITREIVQVLFQPPVHWDDNASGGLFLGCDENASAIIVAARHPQQIAAPLPGIPA